MIDLFTEDFGKLDNDRRFAAIEAFALAQPSESSRHDFKTLWANDALKDIAAFANTFGGLLIIGVEKNQKDATANLIGVQSNSELTTSIASSIATNISPTPTFDIMECSRPGTPNLRFCVIRVRKDLRLCLVSKKGISNPAFVRNADQTLPADAAQLRGLIDRERQAIRALSDSRVYQRAQEMLKDMPIAINYLQWPTGQRGASGTYLKLALVPSERNGYPLDGHDEQIFKRLIYSNYRRVRSTLSGSPPAIDTEHRSADYYEYRWYHKNLDYEGRWRITSALEVAHATQIMEHGDNEWSLMDVVSYSALLTRLGAQWWRSRGYFGDGILSAELAVQNTPLRRGRSGEFLAIFNPMGGSYAISPECVTVHQTQAAGAMASVGMDFSRMHDELPRALTDLMNGLLRGLGHSVLRAEFEENLRKILM